MTTATPRKIEIVVTETVVTTYSLTPEQLAERDLPDTVEALEALVEDDDDTLAVTLLDDNTVDEESYAITDRTIEVTARD